MTTAFTTAEFTAAFDKFMAEAQEIKDKYMEKNFPTLEREVLESQPGTKYIRIVTKRPSETHGSCYCFVDQTNGDILKSATWKAPAKGARGNIFAIMAGTSKTEDSVNEYGAYYKKPGRKKTG